MPDAVSFSSASRTQAVALRYAGTLVERRAAGGDGERDRAGTAHDNGGEDTFEQVRARRAIQAQREAQRTRYDAQPAAHKAERRQSAMQTDTTASGASASGVSPAGPSPTTAASGDPAPAASGGGSAGTGGHTGGSSASGSSSSGASSGQGWGGHGGYSFGIGNILRIGLGGTGPSIILRV